MPLLHCLFVCLHFWLAAAGAAGTNPHRRHNDFVSVHQGSFQLGGSPFRFYGTNAYWLQMTTDADMDFTLHDIATAGFNVVRTWAFNDVAQKPSSGPYFQILHDDGPATINEGPDGLQRLDKLVATAEKYGVKLLLTLTNNWNPARTESSDAFSRRDDGGLPRGYLSNDYGGMDLYVRALHDGGTHDLFYTDPVIISAFKNYLAHVIPRYANSPAVLGWELGSDLRCSSTLPASSACNTHTITNWVADISSYVKTLDSRHLVTAGDGGFYCLSCNKLFVKKTTQANGLLTGPSFDGSYGVDTEDIMAIGSVDFGSFQLFPDQTQYFTIKSGSSATIAINHGNAWITVHGNTARLLGKPEALTAAAIVTKEHASAFIPFNETARRPEGSSCGGVETFQADYAFVSWAGVALNGGVGGVLEYAWLQDGLTSHGSKLDKRLTSSPQTGLDHYSSPFTNQTVSQVGASLPTSDLH